MNPFSKIPARASPHRNRFQPLLLSLEDRITPVHVEPMPFLHGFLNSAEVSNVRSELTSLASAPTSEANKDKLLKDFRADSNRLRTALGAPFAKIQDEGLKIVWAMNVAFQTRGPIAEVMTCGTIKRVFDFSTFPADSKDLNVPNYGLTCLGYTVFTQQVYRLLQDPTKGPVKIIGIGLGQATVTGNHAIISATGATGIDLILDPTTSIVAAGNLKDLLDRKRSIPFVRLSERNDALSSQSVPIGAPPNLGALNEKMFAGGEAGGVNYNDLTYAYCTTSLAKTCYDGFDYLRQVVPVVLNGQTQYWGIQDRRGATLTITSAGLIFANYGGTRSLASICTPKVNAVYMLTVSNDLWKISSEGWTRKPIAVGVSSTAIGPNHRSVYYVTASGKANVIGESATAIVTIAGDASAVKKIAGNGSKTFLLTANGNLFESTNSSWNRSAIPTGVDSLEASRAAEFIPTADSKGNLLFQRISLGQLFARDGKGKTYGQLFHLDDHGAWSNPFQVPGTNEWMHVENYLVALRGATTTILTGNGKVYKFNAPVSRYDESRFRFSGRTAVFNDGFLTSIEQGNQWYLVKSGSPYTGTVIPPIMKIRFLNGYGSIYIQAWDTNSVSYYTTSSLF